MATILKKIKINNFKSYSTIQSIDISDISTFVGANSSGKSTAIQTLLVLKQTMECNSPDIDLLLCGKYVTLGDIDDVLNDKMNMMFSFGIVIADDEQNENTEVSDECEIDWNFHKNDTNGYNCLDSVRICSNAWNILCKKEKNRIFRFYVDGRPTSIMCSFMNLRVSRFWIYYDKEFNQLFKSFINKLFQELFGGKIRLVSGDEMVSLDVVNQLFYLLFKNTNRRKATKHNQKVDELCDNIFDLIDKYCDYQCKFIRKFRTYPDEFMRSVLRDYVAEKENEDRLSQIYSTFCQKLDDYQKKEKSFFDWDGVTELPDMRVLFPGSNDVKQQNNDYERIQEALDYYKRVESDIIGRIFFLGPIRENPKGLYNIGFETIPKYVGPTGTYFASVLLHQNKTKKYLLPDGEEDECTLLEALDEWAVHMNIASEISVDRNNSFGFNVSVSNIQNKKADIMNVGIGTSQVLPVLITGLLSEENEVLLFEQPELHLHPYSQSRLADFFVILAKHRRKIIIETHSEYFLLRLRYHILTEKIDPKAIAVDFFQNRNGTEVKKGVLTEYGNLEYPEDFHDETQALMNDMMNAIMAQREDDAKECLD